MLEKEPGAYYLFTVNNTAKTVTNATFTLKETIDVDNLKIDVVNEDRTVVLDGHTFTDTYKPYEVHIYKITTANVGVPLAPSGLKTRQ